MSVRCCPSHEVATARGKDMLRPDSLSHGHPELKELNMPKTLENTGSGAKLRSSQVVSPHLICAGAANAIEFYKKAFGAVETMRLPGTKPEGSIRNAARVRSSQTIDAASIASEPC